MDDFPFEYVGGGYWRKSGAPAGEPAEILHGGKALAAAAEVAFKAGQEEARQEILWFLALRGYVWWPIQELLKTLIERPWRDH